MASKAVSMAVTTEVTAVDVAQEEHCIMLEVTSAITIGNAIQAYNGMYATTYNSLYANYFANFFHWNQCLSYRIPKLNNLFTIVAMKSYEFFLSAKLGAKFLTPQIENVL